MLYIIHFFFRFIGQFPTSPQFKTTHQEISKFSQKKFCYCLSVLVASPPALWGIAPRGNKMDLINLKKNTFFCGGGGRIVVLRLGLCKFLRQISSINITEFIQNPISSVGQMSKVNYREHSLNAARIIFKERKNCRLSLIAARIITYPLKGVQPPPPLKSKLKRSYCVNTDKHILYLK